MSSMKEEITQYIEECYKYEEDFQLNDVYVTDHQPVAKKYATQGEDEDQDFFDYEQSVDDYNNAPAQSSKLYGQEKSIYERNSMLQRILDPFNGAGSDEHGTIVMNIDDKDLSHL